MHFEKRMPPVGARPGTLAVSPDAVPTRMTLYLYSEHEFERREPESSEDVAAAMGGGGRFWLDVQGFGGEALLRSLGDVLKLHPLVLEDAVNVPQRPKSEGYPEHHLLVARVPIVDDGGDLSLPQVSILFGSNYVVTFQERYLGVFEPVRERMRIGVGRPIRRFGSDYLAYVLFDTLVDHFYPLVEDISRRLDELEEETMNDARPDTLGGIHRVRRQIVTLRRVVGPQRAVVNDLLRSGSPFVTDDVRSYLRDTHDHMAQIADAVDSGRDMTMALMDIYLSSVSHKTNEVMKVLTLMASIFIPLTFLAGIYGMNFEYMPELARPESYPALLVVMLAVAVGMIFYFRRRGWIGGRSGS